MRRAYAEPDGEFVPFAVLRICLENRAPLPRWAGIALLEVGERLLQKPTRRGHNASPHDRDVQRSIDDFRHAVVAKFRRTEKLTCTQAVERAVEYFDRNLPDGGLPGNNGKIFRISGDTSAIRDSFWRVEKLQTRGVSFPKLREEYPKPRAGN